MKRSWTALAVALVAIFAVSSCNDYGNTFQGNTGAVIISLSPPNINAGGGDLTLTVTGGGFVAKTKVQWNGQNLSTTFVNSASVTAVVPAADTAKAGGQLERGHANDASNRRQHQLDTDSSHGERVARRETRYGDRICQQSARTQFPVGRRRNQCQSPHIHNSIDCMPTAAFRNHHRARRR